MGQSKETVKHSSGGLPFDEDEFFISFEMTNATMAQMVYYRAVILPELQHVLDVHTDALIELGKERDI